MLNPDISKQSLQILIQKGNPNTGNTNELLLVVLGICKEFLLLTHTRIFNEMTS